MQKITKHILVLKFVLVLVACAAARAEQLANESSKSTSNAIANEYEGKDDTCNGVTMRVTEPIVRERAGLLKATVQIFHNLNSELGVGGYANGNFLVDNVGNTWKLTKNDALGRKYLANVMVKTHWHYSLKEGGNDASSATFTTRVPMAVDGDSHGSCTFTIRDIPIAKK